jgi:hypothetical protein
VTEVGLPDPHQKANNDMNINKREALALAKVLHNNVPMGLTLAHIDPFTQTLLDLAAKIDRFILVDEADVDYVDEGYHYKASPDKDSFVPHRPGDEDEEEDEEDVEDDDDGEQTVDVNVLAGNLHDLPGVKVTAGTIEFEHVPGAHANVGHVDLLLDGETTIEYVTHLRRSGKSLEVKPEDAAWISFDVARFPKGWATLLPAGMLARVQEGA